MAVLRESTDGDARAKAIMALKEPRANGGTEAEQDEVDAASDPDRDLDPQPLCRRAAIQTLGRFHDPRAVPALTQAYETAGQLPHRRGRAAANAGAGRPGRNEAAGRR